jgi:hypothetical protein
MKNIEALREFEDRAVNMVDGWTRSMQLTVYEILNRRHNCTMINIEHERVRAFEKDEKAMTGL